MIYTASILDIGQPDADRKNISWSWDFVIIIIKSAKIWVKYESTNVIKGGGGGGGGGGG